SGAADAAADDEVGPAARVWLLLVLLPGRPDDLHVHQYDLERAALDLHEQVRPAVTRDRRDDQEEPGSGEGRRCEQGKGCQPSEAGPAAAPPGRARGRRARAREPAAAKKG